ncbi:MAG: hypothetical protein JW889_15850 [Verrucomicrobia bacterium]|nr:hypothetical protein [Verrucomicrobiota bacterium]
MRQDRRILLEALIVSVLGHAVFFNVFTARRLEPVVPTRRASASVTMTRFTEDSVWPDETSDDPSRADPELVALARIERRTAAPMLQATRSMYFPEDEPDLGSTPAPTVGPATWGFRKEPGRMRDEFDLDFDAAPALDAARETLAGGAAEGPPLRYAFDVPFVKAPQAGALRLGPGQAEGPDVRTFRGEIFLNPATGRFDYTFRPSGDPQIDAAMTHVIGQWRFKIEDYKLLAWLRLPKSIQSSGSKRRPPAADEVYGDEP